MKHTIDYEYGRATLYSPVGPDQALHRFHDLASECFGIRKSVGETTLIESEPCDGLPAPWDQLDGGYEMLKHSGGDTIIWNAEGEKI